MDFFYFFYASKMLHDISVLKYAYLECRVNVCAEEFRLAQIIVNSMRVSTRENVQQINFSSFFKFFAAYTILLVLIFFFLAKIWIKK